MPSSTRAGQSPFILVSSQSLQRCRDTCAGSFDLLLQRHRSKLRGAHTLRDVRAGGADRRQNRGELGAWTVLEMLVRGAPNIAQQLRAGLGRATLGRALVP